MKRVIVVSIVVASILLCALGAWVYWRLVPLRIMRQNACRSNVYQIRSSKEQWGMTVGATNNVEVNIKEMSKFIKGGLPICPVIGSNAYVIGRLREYPYCKMHGYGEYDEKESFFLLPPELIRMDRRALLLASPQAPVAK